MKQKRALLKSNPPRDNWMRRRNKTSPLIGGRPKPPHNHFRQTFISEPPHALKNLSSIRPPGRCCHNPANASTGSKITHKFCHRPVILCVADIDQIARLESRLDFVDDGILEDWNTLSLAEVTMRSARAGGLCFESLRDEHGRRNALALIAVGPDSITQLEGIFDLPK